MKHIQSVTTWGVSMEVEYDFYEDELTIKAACIDGQDIYECLRDGMIDQLYDDLGKALEREALLAMEV